MNFKQYLAFKLDEAIDMLLNENKTKEDCALFLMKFKDQVMRGPEEYIIDTEAVEIDERGIADKHNSKENN